MVNDKLCTVCGYEMEEGPRDYNICPSCGTEFGLHDVNSTIDNLRSAWMANGCRWYSTVVAQPPNWIPLAQLAKILIQEASIAVISSNYYSLVDLTPAGRLDAAFGPLDFAYTPHELRCE
jgi:hypothetical protein